MISSANKQSRGIIIHGTIVLSLLACVWTVRGENPSTQNKSQILAPQAKIERVATGYTFTEGPACDGEGNIYFTDIRKHTIMRYDTQKNETHVVHEKTGSANGLMFDREGNLIACAGSDRQLVRYDKDGGKTILADQYEQKKLNSPNDLDIDAKGGIYFTDPRYGKRDNLQQPVFGVYYLDAKQQLVRVIDDLLLPNGLILSQQGDVLYVADNGEGVIYTFEVNTDGTVANKKPFAKVRCDGMTLDEQGNLYAACPTGVEIFSKQGEHIGHIEVPEMPSNVTFGGLDQRTLYITARTSLYRIQMNVAGREKPTAGQPVEAGNG